MNTAHEFLLILTIPILCVGCTQSEPEEVPEVVDVTLEVGPNPNMTISAITSVTLSYPSQVEIEFSSEEHRLQRTHRLDSARNHTIPVVGMRPETEYSLVAIAYRDGQEVGRSEPVSFTTGALPTEIASFELTVYEPEQVQPGITLFSPAPFPPLDERTLTYIGVDEEGYVVWYYQLEVESIEINPDISKLPDGNFLVWTFRGFRIITYWGEFVRERIGLDLADSGFHHDVVWLGDDRFLSLIGEVTEFVHPDTGETALLQGDQVVEVNLGGELLWNWSSLEHLDPTRLPDRLSRAAHPINQRYHLTHTNAIIYLEEEDSVIISIRNQHWLVKIDRETGDIIWRLGWEGDFELINYDEASWNTWFFGQHAPELIADDLILIYDNGSVRRPEPETPFSRATIYRIDEEAMEAELIWSFVTDTQTDFIGDVDLLDNSNVLVCAGGVDVFAPVPLHATIYEVTQDPEAQRIWELAVEPYFLVYRAERVTSLYPGEGP